MSDDPYAPSDAPELPRSTTTALIRRRAEQRAARRSARLRSARALAMAEADTELMEQPSGRRPLDLATTEVHRFPEP